jgi:hypothetical protein
MKKLILPLLFLMSGCTAINSVSFHNMSTSYRDLVEQHNNDNILVNIVRSSKTLPMSFMDISSVYGNGSVSPNMSMGGTYYPVNTQSFGGSFISQPGAYTNTSIGINVSNGFTFTQNSLDNMQFMRAFLNPLGKEFLEFRGTTEFIPKELYLTLLMGGIELNSEDGAKSIKLINNPLDPNFERFQGFLEMLIDAQLQLEEIPSKQLREPRELRLCVNRYAAKELFGDFMSPMEYCAKSNKVAVNKKDYQKELSFLNSIRDGSNKFSFTFQIRSLGNIFDYLGLVLRAQNSDKAPYVVTIQQSAQRMLLSNSTANRVPLFIVQKNKWTSNPISAIDYRNDSYAIEDEDITFTKQVIEFLSILITLSKASGMYQQGPSPTLSIGR